MRKYFWNHIWFAEPKTSFLDSVNLDFIFSWTKANCNTCPKNWNWYDQLEHSDKRNNFIPSYSIRFLLMGVRKQSFGLQRFQFGWIPSDNPLMGVGPPPIFERADYEKACQEKGLLQKGLLKINLVKPPTHPTQTSRTLQRHLRSLVFCLQHYFNPNI